MRKDETVSMDAFDGKSLGITVGKIFDRLAENNSLGEDGGILISVRRSDPDSKASPEKIVKEVQKETESELQKKESRAKVYVFEADEDADTKKLVTEYGITVTKAEFLKRLFAENPEITVPEKEELAGYSSKRLVREIEEHEYQLSLEPVIVKTTFEKASEESTEEETTAQESTEDVLKQETETTDESAAGEETETTENDGLSEMQRRRKALEAGESVDWVDQDTGSYRKDGDDEDDESERDEYGSSERRRNRNTWGYGTSHETTGVPETSPAETAPAVTAAPETVPPETAAPTASETTAAVTETTAASGMLTPETKTPAYMQGPGFEDPDNPRNH